MDENEADGTAIGEAAIEKTLTQSQVNEVVKREKTKAADSARREVEQRYLQQQQANSLPDGQPQQVDVEGLKQEMLDEWRAEQTKAQEQAQQKQLKEEHDRNLRDLQEIGLQYQAKMAAGREKYPDFDEITKGFDIEAFPKVAFFATRWDNTDDIMYELSKNPIKAAGLNDLADKSPDTAEREFKKLSESIAANRERLNNEPDLQPPLSRPQTSLNAGESGNNLSIKDLKSMPWLQR